MFKRADGGFALHGGKILKELAQSLPPFEVIQQGLERNSSPAEHRGSSKNIGVSHDDAVGRRHSRISPSVYPSELRKTNRVGGSVGNISSCHRISPSPKLSPICHPERSDVKRSVAARSRRTPTQNKSPMPPQGILTTPCAPS